MHVTLTLRRPEGRSTAVAVTVDATATVADLARALYGGDPTRAGAAVPETLTLQVDERGGGHSRVLDPEQGIVEAGLRSGSTVSLTRALGALAAPGGDRGPSVATLRVLSGPDAGREHPLPLGVSVLGRNPDVDVRLGDPQVSKRHARISVGETVEVVDLNSANGLVLGGERVSRAVLGSADVLTVGSSTVSVVQTQRPGTVTPTSSAVEFNRSPRVVVRFPERTITAPSPPARPRPSRFPVIALVAPLIMGTVLFAITRNPLSIAFIALSPLLILGNYVDTRSTGRRELRDGLAEFDRRTTETTASLERAQALERAVRLAEAPSTAEVLDAVHSLGTLLWTHRPEHPEFLSLRLGLGSAPSRCVLAMPSTNDTVAGCWERLEALEERFAQVHEVPVTAQLRTAGAVGVAGPRGTVDGVARSLVLQLVGLHSPAELVVTALASPLSRVSWEWLQWLPHTTSPHSPLGGDHLADNAGGGAALLARLEELVSSREGRDSGPAPRGAQREDDEPAAAVLPAVVVVVEDDAPVDRGRLTRLAERGADVSVHVLWVAASVAGLPAVCRAFVAVQDGEGATTAGHVRLGRHTWPVTCESVGADAALRAATALAPVVDVGAPVDDDSDLPRSVSYLALAGRELAESPGAVLDRWRENGSLIARDGRAPVRLRTDPDLRALVGSAGLEPLTLDLRTQGPHALVGGTTGAGKSEFLQAWVLGMAAAHSPDRVSFLFVDYKGGAAFADCVDLPHTVGLVTDLSPHLVRRALTSLRAELRHREHLLNRKNAKDLVTLERTGDPEAPPSLVIVVDEFAALVGEVPEFVDGVVDVAQRGRSLGLHLVLATQRPAGVIRDNLRANTNLRIALRMADESDSVDVLGAPLAAHIDPSVPGRGAAKTGPGRLTPFQSGYAGGRTSATPPPPQVVVTEMRFGSGPTWELPAAPESGSEQEQPADITRVVATIADAARQAEVPAPRTPWMAELAPVYDLALLGQRTDTRLALGVLDDPANQRQLTTHFAPDDEGNLVVYGTGGTGKTTALRTLAVAAGITPRGGPVHVYALDFAGGALGMLRVLPHVGAVIAGDDTERTSRLLRWLRELVDERAVRFSAAGAGTLTEYRHLAERPDEPRVLLLVDGFGAFRTDYEGAPGRHGLFTLFQQLLVDGRSVGVHVAVSADRAGAVPTSVSASIQRKLVLRQPDENSYLQLDVPRDVLSAASPPGRAVEAGTHHEVQVAVLGGSSNVAEQARAVERLAATMRERGAGEAPEIRRLPERVALGSLPVVVGGQPVLGVADDTLEPVGFDPVGPFVVAGPPGSGRTTAVHSLVLALHRWRPELRMVHFCARPSPLASLELWTASARAEAACVELAQRLAVELAVPAPDGEPGVVVVIEAINDFLGGAAEGALTEVVRLVKRNGHTLVAEADTSAWGSSWPLLVEARGGRRGVALQPDQAEGESVFRTDFPRTSRAEFPPGRGLHVHAGKVRRVQLPLPE